VMKVWLTGEKVGRQCSSSSSSSSSTGSLRCCSVLRVQQGALS
jgi:hypothetical protein